jgi:hypothetical protein
MDNRSILILIEVNGLLVGHRRFFFFFQDLGVKTMQKVSRSKFLVRELDTADDISKDVLNVFRVHLYFHLKLSKNIGIRIFLFFIDWLIANIKRYCSSFLIFVEQKQLLSHSTRLLFIFAIVFNHRFQIQIRDI